MSEPEQDRNLTDQNRSSKTGKTMTVGDALILGIAASIGTTSCVYIYDLLGTFFSAVPVRIAILCLILLAVIGEFFWFKKRWSK